MYNLLIKLKNFSAAHRLIKSYKGKCNHLHGHNYRLSLTIASPSVDQSDLVIDFKVVRQVCDQWVQTHLDHATIVCDADLPLLDFLKAHQQHHYVMPEGQNSSAEALSRHLYDIFDRLIAKAAGQSADQIHLSCVEVWESDTSAAAYRPDSARVL